MLLYPHELCEDPTGSEEVSAASLLKQEVSAHLHYGLCVQSL